MTGNAVLVSEDGLMYAQGDVFSIGSGSDGSSILMFRDSAVTVAVIGEVLSIKNPVS